MKVRFVILASLLCLYGTAAQAASFQFGAVLNGASENPANLSLGSGLALIVYDDVAHTIDVHVTFQNLGTAAQDAHIHCCTDPPNNVGVAVGFFPAGFPAATGGTFDHVFDLTNSAIYTANFRNNFGGGTAAGAETALFNAFVAGRAYVNIHTPNLPAGEIRGFLHPVPEPATLSLFGIGAASLLAARRKRRAGGQSRRG